MSTPATSAKHAPTRSRFANNNNNNNNNNNVNTHLCCKVEQEQQHNCHSSHDDDDNDDKHPERFYNNGRASRTAFLSSLCLVLCIASLLPSLSQGYNIDLPSYVRHKHSPANTMFGFSIALHKSRSGYTKHNSLVVGAPKHDTSAYQQNVREAGAVFRCGMEDDMCRLVEFDSSGDHRNTKGEIIERKSYQWLGATVSTGRDNDLVVACAPRYIFHTMTPSKSLRYDPVGTCFTTRNFTQFNEVSPCRTNNWGYHRQGSCQAGFSAAINSNGSRLFIGAPGSWYWQGQTYSISPDATFPYKPPYYQPFGTGGQTYSHDVTRPENQVFSTAESTSLDDDSYLGYSMTTGDFDGDRNEDIAIGMPRGAGLLGKIVVNRWNMANIFNVTGRQIGEYFGYSLATSDVDGDGYDDLIIGAPMYTEPGNVEGKYDVGRVYILLQFELKEQNDRSQRQTWKTEFARDGFNSKGRFGLAVTTLGDVNRDGYGDFAVGAPYDGPEGRGVVYIYHGSARGPLVKPSQIIKSEDLVEGAPYPRTFGFALSGGVDMDSNTYPDLAVGAYASDQVFIFKSRPVAAVDATVRFSEASKLINLEKQTCSLLNNKPVTCMGLETCLKYNGEFLPRDLNFKLSWVLDSRKLKNPRMFFLLDEGQNVRNLPVKLHYNSTFCHVETVYVVDNVQDKLTPLEVELRYDLDNYASAGNQPVHRSRREALQPIIDKNREIVIHDAINIQKNCGKDNICEPDLKLEIKTVDKYLFGSPEPLTIDILITNENEDAFEAAFYMVMPRDLDLKKVQQDVTPPITCTNPTDANNYTLKCDIGNPLPGKKIVNFQVIMTPAEKFSKSPSYDFYMEANSTNPEVPESHFNNIISKSIGIWVDSDLAIEGTSFPDFQLYKASDYKSLENATSEEDLGPQVVHFYNIRNNRPSTIEEAVVFLHYPYETIVGDTLMYMTNQPETAGNIRCDLHNAVNSRKLKLDMNLVRKSYLQQIGAVVRGTGHAEASANGVLIEKSYNNQGGASTSVNLNTNPKPWTSKEKEILEKDDAQDVSGDASFVHSARANDAAAAAEAGSGAGSGSNWSTWSTSWNSSSNGDEPTYIVSAKNSSTYYDANGQRHVVESSTEYVHHLDGAPNAQYSQQQQLQRQQGAANANAATGLGAHSTHGHIQMAGAPGGAYQAQKQQHQYAGSYGDANGKALYGGQNGFQAGVLDLNALQRGNVDNDLRSYGGPQQPQGGNYNYQQSYSSRGRPTTITHQHITYPSNAQKFYGIENENHYDDLNNGGHQQQQQQQQQQWSSSSHHRVRREAESEEALKQIDLNSPCKAAKCQTVRCVVSNLINDDGAWVAMRMRMVAKTMEKLASNMPLNVSTLAVAHVTRLPFIGEPKDPIIKSHEIFYKAEPEPTPIPDVVPLWVVVLAACAGALILLLLIFLLYKCGFFNRNRPRDHSMERQPLRNGYHGDEHL